MEGNTLKNKRVYLDCGTVPPMGSPATRRQSVVRMGSGNEELDGVRIFNPQGKHIGTIKLPERCANLCFGGEQRNRLFMASSTSIYSLYVNAQGAADIAEIRQPRLPGASSDAVGFTIGAN